MLYPTQSPDFDEMANQLLEQGAEQSPSHLHGAVCGLLAGGARRDPQHCLAAVTRVLQMDLHGDLADSCLRLASESLAALGDEEFDFHLFLPADDAELGARVLAVSHWCSAFLTGYALAAAQPGAEPQTGEAAEMLGDISAIAEVGLNDSADEGESEAQLFELTEYLRFTTLNLFMDRSLRAQERAGGIDGADGADG